MASKPNTRARGSRKTPPTTVIPPRVEGIQNSLVANGPVHGKDAEPATSPHPAGRHTLLTPARQQKIVSFIRAGVWDYIAAEASGINQDTFYEWLRRGEGRDDQPPDPRFTEFSEAVRQARAEARAGAEAEVKREAPIVYLTKGPGRDRPGRPGWSTTDGSGSIQQTTVVNVLTLPGWQDVQARLLAALAAHPRARADVLRALAPLVDGQDGDHDGDPTE